MFTRFGGVTDSQVDDKITRGRRIRSILNQPQYAPIRLADEVALVTALQQGLLDHLAVEDIVRFRRELTPWLDKTASSVVDTLERTGVFDEVQKATMITALTDLASRFASAVPPAGAQ